jgi:hypothetical protein
MTVAWKHGRERERGKGVRLAVVVEEHSFTPSPLSFIVHFTICSHTHLLRIAGDIKLIHRNEKSKRKKQRKAKCSLGNAFTSLYTDRTCEIRQIL